MAQILGRYVFNQKASFGWTAVAAVAAVLSLLLAAGVLPVPYLGEGSLAAEAGEASPTDAGRPALLIGKTGDRATVIRIAPSDGGPPSGVPLVGEAGPDAVAIDYTRSEPFPFESALPKKKQ